jgi:hypothetical protein
VTERGRAQASTTSESRPRTSEHVLDGEVVAGDEGPTGRWVMLAEAEEAVGMSRSWLRKQIARGRLPHREVAGPTGKAYSVPLDRVRELAREGTERGRPAEASTSDPARRAEAAAEVVAEIAQLRADLEARAATFDALTSRIDRSWHALAQELADARERAGSAEARARTVDEEAERLRAEVERLRQVELEVAQLRGQVEARGRGWWRRKTG